MYQHIEEFQAALRESRISLAVLRFAQNLTLFTQYWPRNANSYLVVPAQGEPSLLVPLVEMEDAELADLTGVFSYDDVDMASGDPDRQIVGVFRKLAAQYGVTAGDTIGLELDYNTLAPCLCSGKVSLVGEKMKRMVAEGFGCDRFMSVRELIPDIMAVKSESDLKKLRVVNELVAQAMDRFADLVNMPGAREKDVVTEVEKFIQSNAPGFCGARAARAWGQLSTGPKSEVASCEGVVSDMRQLEKGDCCLYEVGACVDGYWADISRSAVVGGAEGRTLEMLRLIDEAFDAGVKAVHIGATGREIDAATRAVMERAGYGKYYLHAAGHGVGFSYHESIPELSPLSDAPLRENMVIAIEPGLYVPGVGGLRKELNVAVTKNGGLVLGW